MKGEQMVAPFAGAWIETLRRLGLQAQGVVAPFAGAWIETGSAFADRFPDRSRALRGRVD